MRHERDFYETPRTAIDPILKRIPLSSYQTVIDAGCGSMAITNACIDYGARNVVSIDTHPIGEAPNVLTCDYLKHETRYSNAITVMNPPYRDAEAFVRHALEISESCLALLRLNFLGSQRRSEWLRSHTPDVYVLSRRPTFTNGGTDSTEYAWFFWPTPNLRHRGSMEILLP